MQGNLGVNHSLNMGMKGAKTAGIYACVAMKELRKIESLGDLIMSEEEQK